VLHVLPHPGGGGETYVRALSGMAGWRAGRLCLAADAAAASPAALLMRGLGGVTWQSQVHDLLHVHGEAAAALCLPALALRPSVVTLHGLHLLRRLQGARRRLAAANLRLVLRAASRTICVSQAEMQDLAATVGAPAARRAVVVLNGVEPARAPDAAERAEARRRFSIPADAVVGAVVGALGEVKDPVTAAQAARQAGLLLVFAGEGPLRAGVEAAGGRVLGKLGEARPALAAADFFVLPSLREGLSFAVLEAMALGLAPVVSDAPGNPEAVGDAGIVVRRGDVAGFAAAFARLRDPATRAALGARARERASQAFGAERMLRETRQVYEEALAGRAWRSIM
jgi:glycosyltransferase involved in cell wall biosynthesis